MEHRLADMTVNDLVLLIVVFTIFGVPAIVALIWAVSAAIRGNWKE